METKKKLMDAFSQVSLKQCQTCDRFISDSEYDAGEGSCFKCWEV